MEPSAFESPPAQEYRLQRIRTESGTGFFACVPAGDDGFLARLAALRQHPMDGFLRLHLLREVAGWDRDRFAAAEAEAEDEDPVFQSLLLEATLVNPLLEGLAGTCDAARCQCLAAHSPLVYLRSAGLSDQDLHRKWTAILARNILAHQRPDLRRLAELPPPVSRAPSRAVTFQTLFGQTSSGIKPAPPDPEALTDTWRRATERLASAGVALGQEMRHIASLSPIALLRSWQLDATVAQGRHRYRLLGEQIAYGRGLSLEAARAACAMEVVERFSAYARAKNDRLTGLRESRPLIQATYGDAKDRDVAVLDPNRLALEVPYADQRLVWMAGTEATGQGEKEALIPAQCVFLFANFDEPALFSALGSTGLAAGTTMAQARLAALMEIVERHVDAVTPFDRRRCFTLAAGDGFLGSLLADYAARGIHLQFQDVGARFGLPCYRAFVTAPDGSVVRGTGAHLDGARAAVSAMTETPYPYPDGPASRPALMGLPVRRAERLPVLASGSAETDLARVETLLRANGLRVFYADLTRTDLDLPVVRAVVPGLEVLADFDRFSRVHPEAFFNLTKTIKR